MTNFTKNSGKNMTRYTKNAKFAKNEKYASKTNFKRAFRHITFAVENL